MVTTPSSRREVFLNFITYFFSKLVALGVFAIIVPISLEALGKDGYAVLMMVLLIIGSTPILDAGISYALTFRYSRALRKGRHAGILLLSEHSVVYFIVSLLLACIFFFLCPLLLGDVNVGIIQNDVTFYGAGAIAVFFIVLSGYNRAILTVKSKVYLINSVDFVSDLLRGMSVWIGASFYHNVTVIVIFISATFMVRWLLMMAITLQVTAGMPIVLGSRVRMRSFLATIRIGAPSALPSLLSVALLVIDKAVIARTQSLSELAVYSLAYDVTTKWWIGIWAITTAIMPVLLRWESGREYEKIRKAMHYAWLAVAGLAVAIYLPLNLFESMIVGWWIGHDMAVTARTYIAVFSLASVVYFVTCVYTIFLQASGRSMLIAKSSSVGFLVYIAVIVVGALIGETYIIALAHVVLWTTVMVMMVRQYAIIPRNMAAVHNIPNV